MLSLPNTCFQTRTKYVFLDRLNGNNYELAFVKISVKFLVDQCIITNCKQLPLLLAKIPSIKNEQVGYVCVK